MADIDYHAEGGRGVPHSPPNSQLDDYEGDGGGPNQRLAISPEQQQDGANDDVEDEFQLREAAAAAAEVAAMERQQDRNINGTAARAGDQAIMGATGNATDDGVEGHENVDELGEMIRQAFLEFLGEFQQKVHVHSENGEGDQGNDDGDKEDDEGRRVQFVKPYVDQAEDIAKRQLERQTNEMEGVDDDATRGSKSGFANTLVLNFEHVLQHDPDLAHAMQGQFERCEPYLRKAVQSFILDRHPNLHTTHNAHNTPYFVAVHNLPRTHSIRQLRMDLIGTLCSVTGTVTRTSDVRPELLVASFRCNACGLRAGKIAQQYHFTRPTLCRNPRCKNKSPMNFTLEHGESEFVDWQKLRVQEHATHIPPGSMPRSMDIIVRNEMVERCKAGDKSVFCGTIAVIPDGSALARAGEATKAARTRPSDAAKGGGGGVRGLAACGVRELTYRTCFVATSVLSADSLEHANQNGQVMASLLYGHSGGGASNRGGTDPDHPTPNQVVLEFTETQKAEIRAMRASPRLYDQMVDSIAPTTFGHREVKKGILLMLLGGVHKTTVDNIKLRGDINVCVVGDPSTAKSQFLKWVHSFWPSKCVYTSGKASSAAGLTAAVQRDQDTNEYCIEAGALMLADNGICCIDEFDKMDISDQVAIHEAMEQQTISITKAGIQATLNARASILAAANPIYGRYDRTKTLKSNIALSAPILSRFDLFFVVLDECNPDSDRQVARHILNVHRCQEQAAKPPFTKDQMRRYIKFARTLHPKLTPESRRVLVDCYRKLRQGDTLGRSNRAAYRITVRQLESMIRLSEALARLHCADFIEPAYVREAFRLLKTSIIQVETSDVVMEEDEENGDDDNGQQGATAGNDDDDDDDNDSDDDETPRDETQDAQMESQPSLMPPGQHHPGEYNGDDEQEPPPSPSAQPKTSEEDGDSRQKDDKMEVDDTKVEQQDSTTKPTTKKKKKKKKTKIGFEEYQAMTHALAGRLREIEEKSQDRQQDDTTTDGGGATAAADTGNDGYLTWGELVEWYLEQYEQEIGDSLDELSEMKSKVNLVIRRLINVDRVLVTIGDAPTTKKQEPDTVLAVHPNYELS